MRRYLPVLALPALALPAAASTAELNVTVEVPTLTVAEYHRPYMAIWVEGGDQTAVANLAVWYDIKLKNQEGETWLKDLRTWWRKSGRSLDLPINGLSGATRAPGTHTVSFGAASPVGKLPPGQYNLVVEAAREVGGREVVRTPFQWPPKGVQTVRAKGSSELGAISITAKP